MKAPQEIIDSAKQSSTASRTRVNQETGEILFDDELQPLRPQDETQPSSEQGYEGGSWVEPKANGQVEPVVQQ